MFEKGIIQVLAQIHPELRISKEALVTIDNVLFGTATILINGYVLYPHRIFIGPTSDGKLKIYLPKGNVVWDQEDWVHKNTDSGKIIIETIKTQVKNGYVPTEEDRAEWLRCQCVDFCPELNHENVLCFLPGALARHAYSEGLRAKARTPLGQATTAQCVDVQFVQNLLTQTNKTGDVVFLTAVLEYIAAEILELAGNVARDDYLMRDELQEDEHEEINAEHVKTCIKKDPELSLLDTRVSGFVLPDQLSDEMFRSLKQYGDDEE